MDNATKLIELAEHRFGGVSEAEKRLLRAVVNGLMANYSGSPEEDNDPESALGWGAERMVRAELIAWICTDQLAAGMVSHRGIAAKGVRIEGRLDLQFARISFPLCFEKSALPDGMNLTDLKLPLLILSGTFTGPIHAEGLKVDSNMVVDRGFKASGAATLIGATIEGSLYCNGGRFMGDGKRALALDRLKVKGGVFFQNGFEALGEVSLNGAIIGGSLECDGGRFINPKREGPAINADQMEVAGSVFFREGFKAQGEVSMNGARIRGTLDCHKGQFMNAGGNAIAADGIRVGASVTLSDGFQVQGYVWLAGAIIGGRLSWFDIVSPKDVTLDLRGAKIEILRDHPDSWPESRKLLLHGLVYDRIDDEAPRDAESRIDWLRRQESFWSQPYEQLAAVLRRGGDDAEVKKILIAKNKDKAKFGELTWGEQCWYRAFGRVIGYGYRPWRAFWTGLVLVLLGWAFFWAGYHAEVMSPAKEGAYVRDDSRPGYRLSESYPTFCAPVYSLDVFVPLVDLHQASYWLPNPNRQGEVQILENFTLAVSGRVLRYYLWFQITAGWVLTTLLVVGVTGLVRT